MKNIKMVGALALLVIMFDPLASFASPNGMTGNMHGWQSAWTGYFNDCFKTQGKNLAKKTPRDSGNFCKSKPDPADFWLAIFEPLAGKESHFKANAKGRNGRRIPRGLYQMDAQDMRSYRCPGTNPNNPKDSICCAIKIADTWSKKTPNISSGRRGILASFFQPMRSGYGGDGRGRRRINNSKNLASIQATSRKLCDARLATNGPGGSGSAVASNLTPVAPAPVRTEAGATPEGKL